MTLEQDAIDTAIVLVYDAIGTPSDEIVTSPIERAMFMTKMNEVLNIPTEQSVMKRLMYLRKSGRLPTVGKVSHARTDDE